MLPAFTVHYYTALDLPLQYTMLRVQRTVTTPSHVSTRPILFPAPPLHHTSTQPPAPTVSTTHTRTPPTMSLTFTFPPLPPSFNTSQQIPYHPHKPVCTLPSDQTPRQSLRNLRHRLSAAISSQRFSDAAILRDQLAAAEAAVLLDDHDAVLAANDAFYDALRVADVDQMRTVWIDIDSVSCAHPMMGLVTGFECVMASWTDLFARGRPVGVDVDELSVNVRKNMAWVVCMQTIEGLRGIESIGGVRVSTNIFQKRRGKWKMVHHHASPVVAYVEQQEGTA